ncbi:class I SAM-dependent methyltransferase [Actinomadura scrupuli]|uniref:class I SAM-dependent methyltransferase n=1 Tax=Actinomadura scrupuli TaxID=559629 RepID=UPI003D95F6C5
MDERSRADYGFDAPTVPVGLGAAAVVSLGLTVVVAVVVAGWWWLIPLVYGLFFGLSCASFLYTTRRGKFVVWAGLLSDLRLTGRERVVDLGCGRGAVLSMLARLVPAGRAIGVDLWRSVDQSNNDPANTLRNATAEAVTVTLLTADMRALPLATGSVDLVVSSLAMHNIRGEPGRMRAVAEAARVRPGGRLVIADFRHARAYADQLISLGLVDVTIRDLGWRFWYGGPWGRTSAVTATR